MRASEAFPRFRGYDLLQQEALAKVGAAAAGHVAGAIADKAGIDGP